MINATIMYLAVFTVKTTGTGHCPAQPESKKLLLLIGLYWIWGLTGDQRLHDYFFQKTKQPQGW